MSLVESPSFCSEREYKQNRSLRMDELSIRPDELYLLYMRLDSDEHEAAKFPSQTLRVAKKAGVAVVRFSFLDEQLEVEHTTSGRMSAGYIDEVSDTIIINLASLDEYEPYDFYFKDFIAEGVEQMLCHQEIRPLTQKTA